MTWREVPLISFTDINNNQYWVHDIKPIQTYVTAFKLKVEANMLLDEVISRPTMFGPGTEDQVYTIIDNNAEQMIDANFNLSGIKFLNIPLIED